MRLGELDHFWRKNQVFWHRLTVRKIWNAARCVLAYGLKRPGLKGLPLHIKVDIAPTCQLRCPVCLQSAINPAERRALPGFMTMETFTRLVDEVAGRTMVLSLYNLGEPLLHPRFVDMARYANERGLNTYITTNLSLPLDDAEIDALVSSGLTMLLVAVDGISEATFGKQRVRGKWPLIETNLRRLVAAKRRLGRRHPYIILQYIVFDHNRHEKKRVAGFCRDVGVDQVNFITGATTPWLESFAPRPEASPLPARWLPLCAWPYFSAMVESQGAVVPCCNYRMDANLVKRTEMRALGDIKQQSFAEIYNGSPYQRARSVAANPVKAADQVKGHFCEGCAKVCG